MYICPNNVQNDCFSFLFPDFFDFELLRIFTMAVRLRMICLQLRAAISISFLLIHISGYSYENSSLRLLKCSNIKTFDETALEYSGIPLSTQHLVVFSICPQDCSSACKTDQYGIYSVDLPTYLNYKVQHYRYQCQAGAGGQDQDGNANSCQDNGNYEEQNSYVDARNYVECQQVQNNYGQQTYIGPICSNNQFRVALFSDQYCTQQLDSNYMSVEDFFGKAVSYHVFQENCMSCQEVGYYQEQDQYDADNVNEMCASLYDRAAKCEIQRGFQFSSSEASENQIENESISCPFIQSIIYDSYTEKGVINVSDVQDVVLRTVTLKQYIALLGFVIFFGVTWWTKRYYERKIAEAELKLNADYVQQMSNIS